MANKNILLIEPAYKNKYPPLGLMKIAAYHGPYGKRDNVRFIKGDLDRSVYGINWDRIYVTTLFSFEYKEIARSIDTALAYARGDTSKVFVGGIAASLMTGEFTKELRWRGIRFITGLLSEAPAISLQLDDFAEELYSDDFHGVPIEDLVPDYSILDQIRSQYVYPVHDAYFLYASRGCVRKCHFCGVPKLEGDQRDSQSISVLMKAIAERYGEKRDLMLMDNNVVASSNYREIIAEIRDNGFHKGSMLHRKGRPPVQRRVDFNQGVDARILCKDKMYLEEMATIAIKPLRIAFDHLGVRKPYVTAIHMAADAGLTELSNYMLYNFKDTPADLYERMKINIDLNVERNIRIFSFPMRYQPTDRPDRTFVSEKWNQYYLRSMQVILQATHGIVSGEPDFFKEAFGETQDEFEALLLLPQHFLFNRRWYGKFGGKPEFDEFKEEFSALSVSERHELAALLSSTKPKGFESLIGTAESSKVNRILNYYPPISEAEEIRIWSEMKREVHEFKKPDLVIPDDELVEDAGLSESA
ncbi:MAG: radical SAM protein [Comamonadaceae bacterium CG_4_9_14_0_8_um_filter_57_21]|nr:MAG: radical SAM protein [Comamonadaceae bacterium CG_4_10_14_0_8_um_filter_57_29]PJC13936.1 MAG: radical SAM protein [Comamonadaceae bacterium CG_4_9_14_0_8_um_filter_57_21]